MLGVVDDARIAELVARVEPDSRVTRTWSFVGGISSEMTAISAEGPDGSIATFVARRWSGVDVEYRVLEALTARGLPVPRPRCFDGEYALLDYLKGAPPFAREDGLDAARAFAEQLVAIHEIDGTSPEFSGLPSHADAVSSHLSNPPAVLDDTVPEAEIRRALEPHWPPPAPERVVLLHGDLWPGNVLWDEGGLVAVIDWEDAAVGDPLADLAVTRLDCLWTYGWEATREVTVRYAARSGRSLQGLAVWDLIACLRPAGNFSAWGADWAKVGRPDVTADTMRAWQREFARQAIDVLG